MPGASPVGSSPSRRVSGAEPVLSAIVSQEAFAARWAVHGGGASPRAVETNSVAVRGEPLPASAESATRAGVTSITLLGGASNSVPTLQPMTSARPAREASFPCVVRIECTLATHVPYPGVAGGQFRSGASEVLLRRDGVWCWPDERDSVSARRLLGLRVKTARQP